jgi:hypothetical protein
MVGDKVFEAMFADVEVSAAQWLADSELLCR